MKTKLQILLFLILCFCLVGSTTQLKAESTPAVTTSNNAPSESYLKSAEGYIKTEKASLAVTMEYDVLRAPRSVLPSTELWKDPTMPEDDWSNANNVGAPVADATLPIVFSIFVLYLIYRSTTTSKRRNNF